MPVNNALACTPEKNVMEMMKTNKHYAQPCIKTIGIDKEISLALESLNAPPGGPYESNNNTPSPMSNDPYKSLQA